MPDDNAGLIEFGRRIIDGKIGVSGHLGDPSAKTSPSTVVVGGPTHADGTPDTTFGEGGFARVDLGPGSSGRWAVVPLSQWRVVAAVNVERKKME